MEGAFSFLLPFFCVTLSQERLGCGALRARPPLLKIVVWKNGNVKEHERTCPERPSRRDLPAVDCAPCKGSRSL
ncbi:hypothetical protein GGQ02_002913 [Salinibacter ruber]|nr:hypothetical protein [Salinibacter ruber]